MIVKLNGVSWDSTDKYFWLGLPAVSLLINFPGIFYGISTTTLNNPAFVEKLLFNPINQIILILAQPVHLGLAVAGIAYLVFQFIQTNVINYTSNTWITIVVLSVSEAIGLLNSFQVIDYMNKSV